ncbi:FxLYD domain-containing protein [Phreatobacter aquaticus]|nr:DUF3426 domain-containing protein [Phreatobacter aquaticus]
MATFDEPPARSSEPSPQAAVDDADWGAAFAEEAKDKDDGAADPAEAPVEADDFPVAEAPSLQPDIVAEPLPQRRDPEPRPSSTGSRRAGAGGADTSKRRRLPAAMSRIPVSRLRLSPSATILALGAAILGLFFLGREQIVRTVPDAASVYERMGIPVNLRGVDFRDVKGAREVVDGVVVLVVEGQLVNITSRAIDLPRLRLAVRDAGGKEIYTWTATAPKPQLGPGEAVAFRSRLASPPPDGANVEVRFFTRLDAAGR